MNEMTISPAVSVCIPAYRHPQFVVRAVNSVFSQTFQDFEVIVTDDSESDEVQTALSEWQQDSRLIYYHNPNRFGSPRNWNRAMELARSDLIKFLHHDDWLTDTTSLARFVEVMQSQPEINFAFSAANACEGDGHLIFVHQPNQEQICALQNTPWSLQFGNLIGAPSATIFRKKPGFEFDPNLCWVVDIDAYLELLGPNPRFEFIPDALVSITSNGAHQVTRTMSRNTVSRITEHLYLYSKRRPPTLSGRIEGGFFIMRLLANCDEKKLIQIDGVRINQKRTSEEIIALSSQKLLTMIASKLVVLKENVRNAVLPHKHSGRQSYAQCGEDMIIDFLLMWLGADEITYLDIGAHHPTWLSNSYHFYKLGHRGVLVEPDETLCKELRTARPADKVLNLAVGTSGDDKMYMYVMTSKTLNTLDKAQAEALQAAGREKIEAIKEVRRLGINEILQEHFADSAPTFVSLDVEGLDFDILRAWDFSHFRPAIFCVETLTYTQNNTERKLTEIIEFMASKEYKMYADTYVNSIFVCKQAWSKRR